MRKLGGRAVPQYFVMVGGGVTDGRAHFARLAAKVPVRRAGEALERLVALYRSEAREGEPAKEFFRRVELARVKETLLDLEALTPRMPLPPTSWTSVTRASSRSRRWKGSAAPDVGWSA